MTTHSSGEPNIHGLSRRAPSVEGPTPPNEPCSSGACGLLTVQSLARLDSCCDTLLEEAPACFFLSIPA